MHELQDVDVGGVVLSRHVIPDEQVGHVDAGGAGADDADPVRLALWPGDVGEWRSLGRDVSFGRQALDLGDQEIWTNLGVCIGGRGVGNWEGD